MRTVHMTDTPGTKASKEKGLHAQVQMAAINENPIHRICVCIKLKHRAEMYPTTVEENVGRILKICEGSDLSFKDRLIVVITHADHLELPTGDEAIYSKIKTLE